MLGAYPSALHVAWTPRTGRRIQALPVDNEPEPFWTGEDRVQRFQEWVRCVGWQPRWGTVEPAALQYNGSSGRDLRDEILVPLRLQLDRVWITDCLDTYHLSDGVKARLDDDIGAELQSIGQAPAGLPDHPSEAQIVKKAIAEHLLQPPSF